MDSISLIDEYLAYLRKMTSFTEPTLKVHQRWCKEWKTFLDEKLGKALIEAEPENLLQWITFRQEEALFISKKGNRLAIRTAQENFQKLVSKSGPFSIAKVTPHSLRHAFASHAVDGDGDQYQQKDSLFHKYRGDPGCILQAYT